MTMREDKGDWMQYYEGNHSDHPPGDGGSSTTFGNASQLAESTAVTSALAAASPGGAQPASAEGRVGKAARRRSRASRKAPTTLVNADPANFRAMVQRFTGAPPGSFHAGNQETSAHSFVPPQLHHQQPGVFPLGIHHHHQQYPQYYERPQITSGGGGDGDGGVFLHGFGGGNTQRSMEASEGYPPEGIFYSQLRTTPPASSYSGTGNGFLFR